MTDLNRQLKKDIKAVEKKLAKLSKVEVPRAHSSALNKVVAKTKTQIVKSVAKDVKVQQKYIKERVYMKRSTVRTQKARITGYASGIQLIRLVKKTNLKVSRGQIVRNRRGQGRVKPLRIAGKTYERWFYQKHPQTGNIHIWQREGRARKPIDIPKVDIRNSVLRRVPGGVNKMMRSDYQRVLQKELAFRIDKLAKS